MTNQRKYVLIDYRNFLPIEEAFSNLGFEVVNRSALERKIVHANELALTLFCMYDLIKSPAKTLQLKARLNENNTPLIVWNRDGPANKGEKQWRQWLLKTLKPFDIYASHTAQEIFGEKENFIYLPNAAWTSQYNLGKSSLLDLRDQKNYKFDVSFHGRINSKKYPEMKIREKFFSELSTTLDQFGITHLFTDEQLTIDQQRELIQKSKININAYVGCDYCYNKSVSKKHIDFMGPSWGLAERCYGIPACGGFLLSDHREHGPTDFPGESEWQSFNNPSDALEKIQFFLANFDQIRDIAEKQHRRVMQEHTYTNRACQLLKITEQWRKNRENPGKLFR